MSLSKDRRIIRTQSSLKEALIQLLMEEADFKKLSIKTVAAKANVNRVTFYSHYKDLDGLLNAIFDDYLDSLLKHFRDSYQSLGKFSSTDERLHLSIFEFIYANQFVFTLIIKGELIPGSQNRFCENLLKLTHREIKLNDELPIEVPALSYFSTYGSLGFFIYWMENNFDQKPTIMAKKLTYLHSKLFEEAEVF